MHWKSGMGCLENWAKGTDRGDLPRGRLLTIVGEQAFFSELYLLGEGKHRGSWCL